MGEGAQSWNAAVTHALQLYLLRREQGRLQEVEDLVRRSVEEYPTYPIWRCVLAQTAAGLGHRREARELLDGPGGRRLRGAAVRRGVAGRDGAAGRGGDRARRDASARPSSTSDAALRRPGRGVLRGDQHGLRGPSAGPARDDMERWDDAERHFEQALEVNERTRARPWVARTKHAYGQMLSASGDSQRGGRWFPKRKRASATSGWPSYASDLVGQCGLELRHPCFGTLVRRNRLPAVFARAAPRNRDTRAPLKSRRWRAGSSSLRHRAYDPVHEASHRHPRARP